MQMCRIICQQKEAIQLQLRSAGRHRVSRHRITCRFFSASSAYLGVVGLGISSTNSTPLMPPRADSRVGKLRGPFFLSSVESSLDISRVKSCGQRRINHHHHGPAPVMTSTPRHHVNYECLHGMAFTEWRFGGEGRREARGPVAWSVSCVERESVRA